MPWSAGDAGQHTKKAKSPKKKRQWSKVANSVLAKSGDEGKAVRMANAAVKKSQKPKQKSRKVGRFIMKEHDNGE